MIEYYTEVCNSFRKEPEIFSIKQTFFMLLLCLLGSCLVIQLIVGSLGLSIGKYLLGIGIPILLLLYIAIRTAGDKLTIGYLYKRLSYPSVPKYIKGSATSVNPRNHEQPIR